MMLFSGLKKNNMDTFLEVNKSFKFVKIHADDKNLQFDLTSDEIEILHGQNFKRSRFKEGGMNT